MATDKRPDPAKDTSQPGREEEVKTNDSAGNHGSHMTSLPVKDDKALHETEGERRFKEGMANNNDSEPSPEK